MTKAKPKPNDFGTKQEDIDQPFRFKD